MACPWFGPVVVPLVVMQLAIGDRVRIGLAEGWPRVVRGWSVGGALDWPRVFPGITTIRLWTGKNTPQDT